MHTHQCIHLRQRSFMSNASACSRGLHSLSLCVVCSCTCASACMEPVLVSLCSQRSSVVHMCVAPHVCCSAILPWSIDSGLFLPLPFPFFHCICYISVKSVLLPFCMGAHSWVARICQSWEQVVANSGSYWMTGALNLHLAMLLLTTWHPSQFLLMSRKHNNWQVNAIMYTGSNCTMICNIEYRMSTPAALACTTGGQLDSNFLNFIQPVIDKKVQCRVYLKNSNLTSPADK